MIRDVVFLPNPDILAHHVDYDVDKLLSSLTSTNRHHPVWILSLGKDER